MKKFGLVLASALALACAVVAPSAVGSVAGHAAASGSTVTVQVKTLTKTLLHPAAVHGEKGWITKGGTPKGKCSGASAAGALDAATHGKWTATYFASFGGVFVDSILGVKPPSKSYYWEIFVNNKASSLGACSIELHAGEKLLFKIAKS